jgi:hypothetical protein
MFYLVSDIEKLVGNFFDPILSLGGGTSYTAPMTSEVIPKIK